MNPSPENPTRKLNEIEYAQLLQKHLKNPPDCYLQLGILNGSCIADVAVLSRGGWHGIEVKTDQDSFARLWRQIYHYEQVFDVCSLMIGQKHFRKAFDELPEHWGIFVLRDGRVRQFREPGCASTPRPLAVAKLLWKDEAYGVLRDRGVRGLSRANIGELWAHLASIPVDELQVLVAGVLRDRKEWK